MISASVMGGAGYIGGELIRLLIGHPKVKLLGTSSRSQRGKALHSVHPNLRGYSTARFVDPDDLPEADVLFTALPHGQAAVQAAHLTTRSRIYIDLSADFRLSDAVAHSRYYKYAHPGSHIVDQFVPGIPELHRASLRDATKIAAAGCMATAAVLALHPLSADHLVEREVDIDARTGSSGSGVGAGVANLHAERSGALRVFAPLDHRHSAEVAQSTGLQPRMRATGVEAVRGVQTICRARLRDGIDERAVRESFARHYREETFVRITATRAGHRLPEPKILNGSNHCDIGFVVDGSSVVVVSALDNLMKGGAGGAVQSLNACMGWPERTGLEFMGLHP